MLDCNEQGVDMIKIINIGGDVQGTCQYQIRVNKQHICNFEHIRPTGLAECLQKAADAVALSEWADYVLMNDSKGG